MPIDFKWTLDGLPGVQRDTTNLNNISYLSTVWTRFYNRKAKKMGGYKILLDGDDKIIRNVYTVNLEATNEIDVYMGRENSLTVSRIDANGIAQTPRYRTPVGFASNVNNTWQFSEVSYLGISYILAVACPNLNNINNTVEGIVYYGRIDNDDPLTPVLDDTSNPITTNGGVTVIGSIIFIYSSNGEIFWNNGQQVSGPGVSPMRVWPLDDNIAVMGTTNFVYGAPTRNGDVLGGLFWGVEGLVKATFTGLDETTPGDHQPTFDIAYVSTTCTLLSSSAVVFYDPYFYWPGSDTFYIYTGVVDELENEMNKIYFFDNINTDNKNKVFGFANTKYQELWWGWSNGDVTENNWGLLYHKKYKTWWETSNFHRACGTNSTAIFPYPILGSSRIERSITTNSAPLWQHEIGVDVVIGTTSYALPASVQFRYIDNANNDQLIVDDLMLDIKQVGDLIFRVSRQGYPRTIPTFSDPVLISPTLEHLTMRESGNFLSFIFESNEVGGDFYFGKTEAFVTGDENERPGPVNA